MLNSAPQQTAAVDVDVHDLNKAIEKLNDQKKEERLPEHVDLNLDQLNQALAILAEILPDYISISNLQALSEANLDLLTQIATKDDLKEFNVLVGNMKDQGVAALSEAISNSLDDPEKLIDICEILCLDPSISFEFRNQLIEIISKLDEIVQEIKQYYFELLRSSTSNLQSSNLANVDREDALKELSEFSLKRLKEETIGASLQPPIEESLKEQLAKNQSAQDEISFKLASLAIQPEEIRGTDFDSQRSELINELVQLTAERANLNARLDFI